MKILGLDYGHKRIGLAFVDELGVAYPIPAAIENEFDAKLARIAKEISLRKPDKLLVGYPYNMDGSNSKKMEEVDEFIKVLIEKFALEVITSDERLSSYQAETDLFFFGKKKKQKSILARQKYRKTGDLDSRAIALVLQDYVNANPQIWSM